MFYKNLKKQVAFWMRYSDFKLKAMEERMSDMDRKIEQLSKNTIQNIPKQ